MNDSNIYGLDNDSKDPNEISTGESAWPKTETSNGAKINDNYLMENF